MALNVYVALCYYKLDYYDVSQEVLGVYVTQHPTSTVAGNLKACNLFRLTFFINMFGRKKYVHIGLVLPSNLEHMKIDFCT